MSISNENKLYHGNLKLMLWKNWNVLFYNLGQLMVVLLIPALFCMLFVVLRILTPVQNVAPAYSNIAEFEDEWQTVLAKLNERHEIIKNKTGKDTFNVFMPRMIIAYAPASYEAFRNIMNTSQSIILLEVELKGFNNCDSLRSSMQKDFYFAGVCFNEYYMHVETESVHRIGLYPNRLDFTLVFPGELRFYSEKYIGTNWNTDELYDVRDRDEFLRRKVTIDDQSVYINEGFCSLQYAISMAYTVLISGRRDLPKINFARFPVREHKFDMLENSLQLNLSFVITVSHLTPVLYFIKCVLKEKEKQTELLLDIMCVTRQTQFFAWLIPGSCGMFVASLLMVLLMKIHWNAGYAILTNSSIWIVLLFLVLYNISSLCICYMITSMFSRTSTGVCVTALVWFLTYLPFIIINRFPDSLLKKLIRIEYLFPNSIMGLGFEVILHLERSGSGLQWKFLFTSEASRYKLSTGSYMLILACQIIGYGFITIILGKVNVNIRILPHRIKNWFQSSNPLSEPRTTRENRFEKTQVFEVKTEHIIKSPVVEFRNITKIINDYPVVKDVSLEVYENEFTVLMGHNGSGKTLLVLIAIGLMEPTSGIVIINNYSMLEQRTQARNSLGVCLSDCLLFDELTVGNQLMLFSLLRGLSKKAAKAEVKKYLRAMELMDVEHVLTRDLTHGLRQQVAVCSALVGGTKVVFLDEPTSKIDLYARRKLWDLLAREKIGRTILMTTHSPDEADTLADRIVMMSNGVLKCSGSASFLKDMYGYGHRLVFFKAPNCVSDDVTKFMRKYIPDIVPDSDIGAELSYTINDKFLDRIHPMFIELKPIFHQLYIQSCSLSELTVADIFYNVGVENPTDSEPRRRSDVLNGKSMYHQENDKFLFLYQQPVSKNRIRLSRLFAMFYKHYLYFRSHKIPILMGLISATICIWTSFAIGNTSLLSLPSLTFELSQYEATVTIINRRPDRSSLIRKVDDQYRQIIYRYGTEHAIRNTKNIIYEFMYKMQNKDLFFTKQKFLIGVSFTRNQIWAWFNNFFSHTAPLALNMVFNALINALLDSDARIYVTHQALPFSSPNTLVVPRTDLSTGKFISLTLAICICYTGSMGVMFLVKEKASRFKLLQLIAGLPIFTYWFSTLLSDMFKVLCTSTITMLIMLLFFERVFAIPAVIGSSYLIFVLTGISLISVNYVLTTFFEDRVTAYIAITVLQVFGCVSACLYISIFVTDFNQPLEMYNIAGWFFRIFPLFSFSSALVNIYGIGVRNTMCKDPVFLLISKEVEDFKWPPKCSEKPILHFSDGIIFELIALSTVTIVSWILLFIRENHFHWCSKNIPNDHISSAFEEHQRVHSENPNFYMEDDVIKERLLAESKMLEDPNMNAIVCHNLGHLCKDHPTLNRLSFHLGPSDSFALTGPNGSGKSMLLKILVGDKRMSYGKAFIRDVDLTKDPYGAFKYIGYCQSNSALLLDFTRYETLMLFCLIHGIKYENIPEVCKNLAKILGFYTRIHEKIMESSDGNVMRTNYAIAILKNPPVLCLDLPIAYVDIAGRRQMWNVINEMRRRGTAVIFSSVSMRDCERYCTKIAIMHEGWFSRIGHPFQLAHKHTEGYCIYFKLKCLQANDPKCHLRLFLNLTTYMENNFPTAIMRDNVGNLTVFFIPLADSSLGEIFKKIHRNIFNLNLETFAIKREMLPGIYMASQEREMQKLLQLREE